MERPTQPSTIQGHAVITSSARPISIYANSLGDVVIRQAASGFGEKLEDDVIVVRRASLAALTDALIAEADPARVSIEGA